MMGLVCSCVFETLTSVGLDTYPGVGLPGHMVDLFLVFKESTHCTVYKELSVTREDSHNRMSRGKAATLYKQHYLNQGIYVI